MGVRCCWLPPPRRPLGHIGPESSERMALYRNLGGNSNVSSYEIGPSLITVTFRDGAPYTYTYQSAGTGHVETMKKLAIAGRGLNSYINTHVRHLYASKG
jgi:hypothetical protein